MTGPTSWMQFQDVQSTSGRSEAWSELLGLRSNPRTSPQLITHSLASADGTYFPPLSSPASLTSQGFVSTLGPMTSPSTDSKRRKSQNVNPSKPQEHVLPLPPSGLHALDPFFCPATGGSGRLAPATSSSASSEGTLCRAKNTVSSSLGDLTSKAFSSLPSAASHCSLVSTGQGQLRPCQSLSGVSSETALVQHEAYRKAAMDFVLELAGPQVPINSEKSCYTTPNVIKADELPIPTFAIGRDACVCMWNCQMEELSGWSAEEVLQGNVPLADVFQPETMGHTRSRGCLELMRSVLFGLSVPPGTRFLLKKKSGEVMPEEGPDYIPVELRFSRRTDMAGTISGVLCVVVQVKPVVCEARRSSGASRKTFASLKTCSQERWPSTNPASDRKNESVARSEFSLFERCTAPGSSCGSYGTSSVETSLPSPLPSPSVRSLTHSTEGPALPGADRASSSLDSLVSPSREVALPEVKALVLQSADAVLLELKQNLERCGVDVTGCSSLAEAMWRFERNLTDRADGLRFNLVFLELEPNRDELFLAIRDLRRMEVESRIMGQVPALEAMHQAAATSAVSAGAVQMTSTGEQPRVLLPEPFAIEEESEELGVGEIRSEADLGNFSEDLRRQRSEKSESSEELTCIARSTPLTLYDVPNAEDDAAATLQGSVAATLSPAGISAAVPGPDLSLEGCSTPEHERRCLILAVVNLNRWNLAALDVAMEQCVRAGGDAVLPRGMPLQHLKTALKKFGVKTKYLMFPSRLPRALSGCSQGPLNLSH